MTYLDFCRYYDPEIKQEEVHFILMEKTAYPFSGTRYTINQILRAFRIKNNNIKICEFCDMKYPYHKKGCIAIEKG